MTPAAEADQPATRGGGLTMMPTRPCPRFGLLVEKNWRDRGWPAKITPVMLTSSTGACPSGGRAD